MTGSTLASVVLSNYLLLPMAECFLPYLDLNESLLPKHFVHVQWSESISIAAMIAWIGLNWVLVSSWEASCSDMDSLNGEHPFLVPSFDPGYCNFSFAVAWLFEFKCSCSPVDEAKSSSSVSIWSRCPDYWIPSGLCWPGSCADSASRLALFGCCLVSLVYFWPISGKVFD